VRWLLFTGVVLIWTGLCLWPNYDGGSSGLINDKLAHGIGNFVLFGVLLIAYQRFQLLPAAILVALYSFGIELAQLMVPGRFFDLFDMLANISGIAVAAILVRYLNHKKES